LYLFSYDEKNELKAKIVFMRLENKIMRFLCKLSKKQLFDMAKQCSLIVLGDSVDEAIDSLLEELAPRGEKYVKLFIENFKKTMYDGDGRRKRMRA
jgi:hypothetical protein